MAGHAAISINNDLPASEACIANRTAYFESACRVDVIFGVSIEPFSRENRLDDFFHHQFSQISLAGFGAVLAGQNNRVDTYRLPIFIAKGNLALGQSLLPRDHKVFALRVRGDSMIEKGILDGDTVIVHSQQTADSGQIVVAMIEGEATVKTFKSSAGAIRLEPANPAFKPIVIHPKDFKTTTILGVVTGVFRQL